VLCCAVLVFAAVAPIFKAAMDVFERLIMSMHKQSWAAAAADESVAEDGAAAAAGVTETSSYVTELANAIAVFR
jgi:hypothetical protein